MLTIVLEFSAVGYPLLPAPAMPTALPWYATAFKHGIFYRLLANTAHLSKFPAASKGSFPPPHKYVVK